MICFVVFLLLSAAAFFFLRLDYALLDWITARAERKAKIKSFKKQSRISKLVDKLLAKCVSLITNSQMPKTAYYILTVVCAVGGYCAGKVIFSSFPIALAVGTFGLIAPLLFFSFRQTKAKTAQLERLASSMMILSNSYVVTEDFITSVRDNLEILEYPEPFKDFLTYVTLMDSSVGNGLRRMEAKVNNPYFSQWIDALVLAQEDRSLKYVTVTVVDSMHDVLSVQAESDAAMYAVWRDYLMTLIMIFSVPLIFKFTLADAYLTLTGSLVGQSMFILLLAAVIFSVFRALKINKPLMM
ncbi:MAG: hypothetical protein PUC48_06235 [Paraprevotella sp.]|nr:hypothetical protein [Paraprevotella sp.]